MTRAHIKQAVRLWRSDLAPREIRRANARKWLLSIHHLGPNWILAGRKEVTWGAKQRRTT